MFIILDANAQITDPALRERIEGERIVQFGVFTKAAHVNTFDAIATHADDDTLAVEFDTHVELYTQV